MSTRFTHIITYTDTYMNIYEQIDSLINERLIADLRLLI